LTPCCDFVIWTSGVSGSRRGLHNPNITERTPAPPSVRLSRKSVTHTCRARVCVVSSCPACQTTSTALLNRDCDLPRRARHVRRSTDSTCDTTIEEIGCRAKAWTSTGHGPTVGRRDVVTSETVDRPVRWLAYTKTVHTQLAAQQHTAALAPPHSSLQQAAARCQNVERRNE
jgi:hypothetical protein